MIKGIGDGANNAAWAYDRCWRSIAARGRCTRRCEQDAQWRRLSGHAGIVFGPRMVINRRRGNAHVLD